MKLKYDSASFKENIELLKACSLVKEIQYTTQQKEFITKELLPYFNLLNSPEYTNFRLFLQELSDDHCRNNGQHLETLSTGRDFIDVPPVKKSVVPSGFAEQYAKHRKIASKLHSLENLAEEQKEFRKLVEKSPLEAVKQLHGTQHSKSFQQFANQIKSHPAIALSLTYKRLATELATKNNLYTNKPRALASHINNTTFNQRIKSVKISLDHDFNKRFFRVLSFGVAGASIPIAAKAISSNETSYEPPTYENVGQPTAPEEVILPISKTSNLHSYEDACRDLYTKISEVYKHQTGKDIDLSGYEQENLGRGETTIVEAQYNGKTYRFSTISASSTNRQNLLNSLTAAGATFTTRTDTVTFISDNGKSIAIVDSKGNPIQSGNITEKVPGGTAEMYNQDYLNTSKENLEAQGIDTSDMSEAEIIGKYILSDEYDIQNPDLSAALGKVSSLTSIIKRHFYTSSDGQQNSYAIHVYTTTSNEFANTYNTQHKTLNIDDLTFANNTPADWGERG